MHELQATILHPMGIDHDRLTFEFQVWRNRLTGVHGEVVREVLAGGMMRRSTRQGRSAGRPAAEGTQPADPKFEADSARLRAYTNFPPS